MNDKVAIIIGTRPEIIKISSVVKAFEKSKVNFDVNQSFIDELSVPSIQYNIGAKGMSAISQISNILERLEEFFTKERPGLLLVQDDTNTALGGALLASKMDLFLRHIESGCKSFVWKMPEEANRVLTDKLADLMFARTDVQKQNLLCERVDSSNIHEVGDPTVELLDEVFFSKPPFKTISIPSANPSEYFLLTVHRSENIANKDRHLGILEAANRLTDIGPVVFPFAS